MKSGNVNDFLDHMHYEEVECIYNNFKYFFNAPCADKKTMIYHFEIYKMTLDESSCETIYQVDHADPAECIKLFITQKIFENKSFWEAESEMEWVD